MDSNGTFITLRDCQIPPAVSFSLPKPPLSVIRVNVTSADKSTSITVNALFSMAAQASSMSARLAERLGLAKGENIYVSSLRSDSAVASLPSSHVDVECTDVVCSSGKTIIPKSIRVAFVIMPNPGNDMVLGEDWFEDLQNVAERDTVLDFAPDKCRLRFLSAGEEVLGQADLFRFAQQHTGIDEGDFISLKWGRPDFGPSYDPDPMAADFSHHVRPDHVAREALERIRLGDV